MVLIAVGLAFFIARFPFSRDKVKQSLEEDFHGQISFQSFRTTYFPHPGCVAEGLTLVQPDASQGSPPLVYVQKFTLRAHYVSFLLKPGYISRIVLDGLHIQIPPKNAAASHASGASGGSAQQANNDQSPSKTVVGEVVANNALLEVARQHGKDPLRFEIHALTLHSVSHKDPISYDVAFLNALPPGEIQSRGRFGPLNSADPSKTPVSGTYQFVNANLDVFHGIRGTLSSHDNFQGTIRKIETRGTVDIPDFKVTRAASTVPLHTRFHAFVDGFNGDVHLEEVDSSLWRTAVIGKGSVAGRPNHHGKTTSLDLNVNEGRIQDLFRIFIKEPRPPFSGVTSLRAHVDVPPEGRPFLQELRMNGDFGIAGGHFTKPDKQEQIAHLSERAQGKRRDDTQDDDPERVLSDLSGHAVIKDGVATFTQLSFSVPGALAQLHGTFNLLNQKIDFHGTLKTDASLSKTAGGIKSIFLKPFDVFFKKEPKGAEIPIQITGTYAQPHYGIDLAAKVK